MGGEVPISERGKCRCGRGDGLSFGRVAIVSEFDDAEAGGNRQKLLTLVAASIASRLPTFPIVNEYLLPFKQNSTR